jgi:starvation-inducible DNA-binding protein
MERNHTQVIRAKLQVSIQPNIGLDGDVRKSILEMLNIILADEAVLAMKTRNSRWHLGGIGFLDLRSLFDHQFHQLNKISDEIADRVRMLGGYATSSFEQFRKYNRLEEQLGEDTDIMTLLAGHEACVRFLREDARKCFEEYEDHSTHAQLVRFIALHEKMAWILRSYIEPEMTRDENTGTNSKSTSAR